MYVFFKQKKYLLYQKSSYKNLFLALIGKTTVSSSLEATLEAHF